MITLHFLILLLPFFGRLLPPAGSPESFSVASIPAALKQDADIIVRRYDTTFEVLNTSQATEKVTYVYTILDRRNEDDALLKLHYSRLWKINYIKGTLYDKNGVEIQKLKAKDIQDLGGVTGELIDDSRVKIAGFQPTQYPVTVAFEYETSYEGSLFYPTWQPQEDQNQAVEKASFQVILPQGRTFRYKALNGAAEPVITAAGNRKVYSWTAANIAAFDEQPFQPDLASITPLVYTAPNEFSLEKVTGNMSTWADFGNWIKQLNQGRTALPAATVAQVKALAAAEPNELARIQKLYAYMQNKTRYVSVQLGIGGWQPFEAGFVDAKGYGDCKALTNYMHALLQTADIKSYYTLIRAGENAPEIQKDFPSNQFNHVILCVPAAKDTVWLECTDQSGSWGYNGAFTGNRHGLLITPQGGKLVRTSVYGPEKNLLTRKATINLDAQGNAHARTQTIYTGLQQDEIRQVMAAETEDQKKWLQNQISLPNFSLSAFNFKAKDGFVPEVSEALEIKVSKYASQNGKRFFLTPNFSNRFSVPNLKKTDRTLPIVLNTPFIDSDEITYQLPAGIFQPESMPEPIQFKSTFGEYQASCRLEGDKLIYTRTFKMNSGKFPAARYQELADFCRKVSQADRSQVVLVSKT